MSSVTIEFGLESFSPYKERENGHHFEVFELNACPLRFLKQSTLNYFFNLFKSDIVHR
jgi:hypothetical protein